VHISISSSTTPSCNSCWSTVKQDKPIRKSATWRSHSKRCFLIHARFFRSAVHMGMHMGELAAQVSSRHLFNAPRDRERRIIRHRIDCTLSTTIWHIDCGVWARRDQRQSDAGHVSMWPARQTHADRRPTPYLISGESFFKQLPWRVVFFFASFSRAKFVCTGRHCCSWRHCYRTVVNNWLTVWIVLVSVLEHEYLYDWNWQTIPY